MENSMMIPQQQQMPQGNSFNTPTPQQAPTQPSSDTGAGPEEIAGGHRALDATMDGLIKLVGTPPGELTKKDVFNEASTMIAHGAFPTPEAKQQLIAELAKLPDDEAGIRKILGKQLLNLSIFRSHMHNTFGPPAAPQEMLQQGVQQ